MNFGAEGGVISASIGAVVIRGDGRREDLGIVSYWHRSFFKRLAFALPKATTRGPRRLSLRELCRLLRDTTGATVFTHAGKAIVTDRVKGAGGAEPLQIGWGTGAGTAAVGDTTLFTEKATDLSTGTGTRTAGTSSRTTVAQTNDNYRVTGTRTATGAGTVTNAGLFDNNTIASGSLLMKGDFTGIGLASSDSIAFTMDLQFT
jgi:hypothetical protein